MSEFQLKYKPYGAHSILIEWPAEIDELILSDVLQFKKIILNHYIKLKVEINHAYNSILINYGVSIENVYDEFETLKLLYQSLVEVNKTKTNLWKIPVCYAEEFGLDLDEMCAGKNITKDALIALHSKAIYTVYFIGFLPGFLYLGGLDHVLKTPRKSTPRLNVKKGSVAIGGNQTGVYPVSSPGGWNIIGNSPIDFFNASDSNPCFAKSGDKVQFYSINLKEHHDISKLVNAGIYQLESEVMDG